MIKLIEILSMLIRLSSCLKFIKRNGYYVSLRHYFKTLYFCLRGVFRDVYFGSLHDCKKSFAVTTLIRPFLKSGLHLQI